jgi:hypothetical protein
LIFGEGMPRVARSTRSCAAALRAETMGANAARESKSRLRKLHLLW